MNGNIKNLKRLAWLMFIFGAASAHAATVTVSGASAFRQETGTYWFSTTTSTGIGTTCDVKINAGCITQTSTITFTFTGGKSNGIVRYKTYNGTLKDFDSAPGGLAYTAGGTVTGTITGLTLCQQIFNNTAATNPNCAGDPTAPVTTEVGVAATSGATAFTAGDSQVITMSYDNIIEPAADDDNTTSTSPKGLYKFTVVEGDEKLRIKNISAMPSFPQEPTGSGIYAARFYYAEGDTNFTKVRALIGGPAGLAGAGSYAEFPVSGASLVNPTLTGLKNETKYSIVAALVDQAGNVGYLTPVTSDIANHQGVPGSVVGLLAENQGCFIATAAYGSSEHKWVQVLREFRDRILLKSPAGRKFVGWYYSHSPDWADWIRQSENKRAAVRVALWPLIFFGYLALKMGIGLAFLLLATLLMFPLLVYRFLTTPLPKRPAANKLTRRACFQSQLRRETVDFGPGASKATESTGGAALRYVERRRPSLTKRMVQKRSSQQKMTLKTRPKNFPVILFFLGASVLSGRGQAAPSVETQTTASPAENRDSGYSLIPNRPSPFKPRKQPAEEVKAAQHYDRPQLMKITKEGTYIYKPKPIEHHQAASLHGGPYSPKNLSGNSGYTLSQIYDNPSGAMVGLDYEYQFFKGAGILGAKGGFGVFTKKGTGKFKNPQSHVGTPEETFNLIVFPFSAGVVYRAQFWDRQPVIPFAELGADHFTILETRSDKKSLGEAIKTAGANGFHWAAGASLQLDWLDRANTWALESEYGISHIYLVGNVKGIIGLNQDLDFTAIYYEGGIMFEF